MFDDDYYDIDDEPTYMEIEEENNHTYYWARVFDYEYERDFDEKGIMLDEMYFIDKTPDEIKSVLKEKYTGKSSQKLLFKKPNKKNGIYVILLESNETFYKRFMEDIDDICFFCNRPIKGKKCNFPSSTIKMTDDPYDDNADALTVHFCSYECKEKFYGSTRFSDPSTDGEWQHKEKGQNGRIYGYIYKIENIRTNSIYIGQTRYLPMFRWQEHVKDGIKGEIEDLVFSVITKVPCGKKHPQKALDDAEAWWIRKFMEEENAKGEKGAHIMNVVKPEFSSVMDFKKRYDEMVSLVKQGSLFDLD